MDAGSIRDLADKAYEEDTKKPNGSSIALLFEYRGRRVLFGADAFKLSTTAAWATCRQTCCAW